MPIFTNYSTVTYNATLSLTTTRTALPSNAGRTVFLRNAKTSGGTAFIGDATVTSAGGGNVLVDLQPGEGMFVDVNNASLFNAVAATTATLFVTVFK